MSMVVQHNLQAMNANRLLGITSGQQSKSTEKLSSGYRINRAADDAAGLTISEKMRRQIRGLSQASTNAQDGVSSVQTAEGALTEVHSMLQRMNELAVQASNGTQSQNDRDAIQAEIDQLSTEIDRVAETTKFNEIYLLKGDKDTKTVKMAAHDAGLKGTLTDNGDGTATFVMDALKAGESVNIGGKNYKIIADANQTKAEAGKDYEVEGSKTSTTLNLTGIADNDTIDVAGKTYTYDSTNGPITNTTELADAIKADLGDAWNVSVDANNVLTIEAAEKGEKDAVVIDNINIAANGTAAAAVTAGTFTGVTADIDLYAQDGTKALTADEIAEAVKNGKDLFTTPGAGSSSQSKKVTADDYVVEGTKATTTLDLTGWNTGDTISINSTAYAQGTYTNVSDVVDAIQADLGDEWVVSADANDVLTIEAAEKGKKDAIVIDTITVGGATTVAPTATAGTTTGVTVDKPVYAKGGTKALTAEEIQAAYDNNETLYFDKAERADNEITITEAYKLAEKELLKANQIGDMNGTATVTNGAGADGGTEKTAADYTVGGSVTIDGTEYTVGDTAANALAAITGAISDATTAVGASTGSNGSPLKAVGSVSDGTTTVYLFSDKAGGTVYSSNNSVTFNNYATGTLTGADLTSTDVDNLITAGAKVTFTPDAAATGVTETVGAVADDTADGSTVISAAKAAELENAANAGDDDAAAPAGPNVFNITTASADVAKTLSFNLHVGADADMTNKIQVDIDTMNSAFLGIKDLNVSDEGGMSATYAIDAIQDAISKVSAQRSALGAIQNRLEHTISNLDNVVENTTSAESRIRDTDMASEMVEYSKNNILAQAGQAMLAQANQSTQGVLSLLG